ncbi:MAG: alpha/beta hydrolase [Atopobiaceae bacterium]|nr:alpha/beta hydrolase [Atopobiaceae bacterium]
MPDKPTLVTPTPDVPLAEFPRNEELPEGCLLLEGTADDNRLQVECRELTYVTRTLANGLPCPRKIYVLIPSSKDPIYAQYEENGYPCVVFCQGSAWHRQNLYVHFTDHVRLAERGFVVASVQYRESDLAPFPAQMQDFKTAVRYLRAHATEFHIDPERLGFWGDSSGGHTVLMASLTAEGPAFAQAEGETIVLDTPDYQQYSCVPRCVVDWYGPAELGRMNLVPSAQDHTEPGSPEGQLIGGRNVLEHPEWAWAASPVAYVPEASERALPPVLIMHGGRDQLVNFDQSCRMYERLRQAGQDVTFYKLPDANHGSNGFRCQEALDVVEEFLRTQLG